MERAHTVNHRANLLSQFGRFSWSGLDWVFCGFGHQNFAKVRCVGVKRTYMLVASVKPSVTHIARGDVWVGAEGRLPVNSGLIRLFSAVIVPTGRALLTFG